MKNAIANGSWFVHEDSKWIPKGLGFQFCIEILICLAVPSPDFQEVNYFQNKENEGECLSAGDIKITLFVTKCGVVCKSGHCGFSKALLLFLMAYLCEGISLCEMLTLVKSFW